MILIFDPNKDNSDQDRQQLSALVCLSVCTRYCCLGCRGYYCVSCLFCQGFCCLLLLGYCCLVFLEYYCLSRILLPGLLMRSWKLQYIIGPWWDIRKICVRYHCLPAHYIAVCDIAFYLVFGAGPSGYCVCLRRTLLSLWDVAVWSVADIAVTMLSDFSNPRYCCVSLSISVLKSGFVWDTVVWVGLGYCCPVCLGYCYTVVSGILLWSKSGILLSGQGYLLLSGHWDFPVKCWLGYNCLVSLAYCRKTKVMVTQTLCEEILNHKFCQISKANDWNENAQFKLIQVKLYQCVVNMENFRDASTSTTSMTPLILNISFFTFSQIRSYKVGNT